MDTAIANKALDLAMAWGADWLKPTQPRLKVLYPALSDKQLDEYDAVAQAAMVCGFKHMYDAPNCEIERCAVAVRDRFPWVSDENISRLHSQGMYYAMK